MMAAARARGDEDEHGRQRGDSRTVNDGGAAGHQQQQYMRQHYDAAHYPSYNQQHQRREYDDPARPSHQQPQQYRQYDNVYPADNNYSKEQIDMQEVSNSNYPPPSQQYLNPVLPPPHGSAYSGSGAAGSGAPNNATTRTATLQAQAQRSNTGGPAYAPAPVATASMADLRDSMTNSSTASHGAIVPITAPGKKPKRVYETAFGPFSWSDLVKRKYWKYYAILIVIGIAVLLAVIFHDDIIRWMEPIAEKIRDIPGGWAIWV